MRPRVVFLVERALGQWAGALVPGYAALLVLGALVGAVLMVTDARRLGFRRSLAIEVLLFTWPAALLGAGAVPFVQGVVHLVRHGWFHMPTGLAAYGGLIGGVLGGALRLRRARADVWAFLDACAPGVGVGIFFARLGCLLAGCDYGRVWPGPGALRFPPGSPAFRDQLAAGMIRSDAPASLPVWPSQIAEALLGVALFAALSRVPPRRDGRRFVALALGYGLGRALLEAMRGDVSRGSAAGVSTSQWLALASCAAVLWLYARRPPDAAMLGRPS